MNRAVAPGDDFNEYANGTWLKKTEIPADRAVYDTFTVLAELAETRTRRIIDEAVGEHRGQRRSARRSATTTPRSWTRLASRRRATPSSPSSTPSPPSPDKPAWRARSARRCAPTSICSTRPTSTRAGLFGLWVSQDMDEPAKTSPYLVQGGLGLPDRDFYLDAGKRIRRSPRRSTRRTSPDPALAAAPDADAKAARIIALETAIARVHATQVDTNDVKKGDNHWTRQRLRGARRRASTGTPTSTRAGLGAQQTVRRVAAGCHRRHLAPRRDSSRSTTGRPTSRSTRSTALRALMPKAFADEAFAFYGTDAERHAASSRSAGSARSSAVDNALGEAVGRIYARALLPASGQGARRRDGEEPASPRSASASIALEWMSRGDQGRGQAQARRPRRRRRLSRSAGATTRRSRSARDDALGNASARACSSTGATSPSSARPVDRSEWFLLPQEVNALNLPLENRLIFPAAILEPPFFDLHADDGGELRRDRRA